MEREKVQELHSLARETLISIGIIRDAIPEGTGKDTWKFPRWIHENNMENFRPHVYSGSSKKCLPSVFTSLMKM